MSSTRDALRYLIRLMRRGRIMTYYRKSGKDAHVEEQMICSMLHKRDAVHVVGGTLTRQADGNISTLITGEK